MSAAKDFIVASLGVVLAGIGDDATNTFADAFADAVAGGAITCWEDTAALVGAVLRATPDEAVEVALLVDQLVSLARAQPHNHREGIR